MSPQFESRLSELKSEYEAGQKLLAELDARRANLMQTLLRIEGAMQVLRELMTPSPRVPPEEAGPPGPTSDAHP